MPCLEDLYLKICDKPELKSIAVIIKDLAAGGMAGRTNVNLNSDFIVLDTSGARDGDLSAATFMATVFIRDEISRSRTDKKAVFGDELWIIAGNEGNGQAADFVIKLVKTIRGYGGIFVSASQNATDFFALSSVRLGDAVLYKLRKFSREFFEALASVGQIPVAVTIDHARYDERQNYIRLRGAQVVELIRSEQLLFKHVLYLPHKVT